MSVRDTLCKACLLLLVSASAAPLTQAGPAGSKHYASPRERLQAEARIVEAVRKDERFPDDANPTLNFPKLPVWSTDDERLLAPVVVRFKEINASFCRLAILSRQLDRALLVEVPDQSNHDSCQGFDTIQYLDINGDGLLDVIVSVSVKANRFEGYVGEQQVYISAKDRPAAYCYSQRASANLTPLDMSSEATVRRALNSERKRLGLTRFTCD